MTKMLYLDGTGNGTKKGIHEGPTAEDFKAQAAKQEEELFASFKDLDEFPEEKVCELSMKGLARLLDHIQAGVEKRGKAYSPSLIDKMLFQLRNRVYSAEQFDTYKEVLSLYERLAWLRGKNMWNRHADYEQAAYLKLLQATKSGTDGWATLCYRAEMYKMVQDMLDNERGFYPHVGY